MDLSVIIPTYNRSSSLRKLLSWLLEQTVDRRKTELIFVNDGSTDDTYAVLAAYSIRYSWMKIIHQENQGQAAARQAGARIATGRFLLFLDDDMEPCDPFFLEKHRRFQLDTQLPTVAIGSILPPVTGPRRPAFEYFYERSLHNLYQGFRSGKLSANGRYFFSANVSLPADLFWSVDGFDPHYRHAEDRELGLRLEFQAGASFHFLERAAAYHHSLTGRYAAFQRRAFLYGYFDKKMSLLYPDIADLDPVLHLQKNHALKRFLQSLAEKFPKIENSLNMLLKIFAECGLRILGPSAAANFCSLLYTFHYVRGLQSAQDNIQLEHHREKETSSYAS